MEEDEFLGRHPVLIGDIGGTNARLSIKLMSGKFGDDVVEIETEILSSKSFKSITDLLQSFLQKFIGTENYPSIGVIGIPGPIFDNTITIIANLDWPKANGAIVAKDLKMRNIVFLNDFVTNGYGILSDVKLDQDYVKLNDERVDAHGPIAMIGAGTGLGHGYLVRHEHGRYHHVFPSEGGHQDFAPQNEMEWRYFKFLQTYYKVEHISIERACSGPAIPVMLFFMIQSENLVSTIFQTQEEILKASPEQIIKHGLEKKCSVCEKVIEFFVTIYAAAAGNMSLLILPTGGLYLLGGLSVALEKYIVGNDIFRNNFKNKGRLEPLLARIPLFAVTNSFIGVKGAQEYARRMIERKEHKNSENNC